MSQADEAKKWVDMMGLCSSYSEMLRRIWLANAIAGFVGFWILFERAEPAAHLSERVLAIVFGENGPPWGPPALALGCALFVATISRAYYLHTKLGELFGLRRNFNYEHMLLPLAEGAGLSLGDEDRRVIMEQRRSLSEEAFYEYVGDGKVKISQLLVQKALDSWSWFWVWTESGAVFLLVAVGAILMRAWDAALPNAVLLAVVAVLGYLSWRGLPSKTAAEIEAILSDDQRRARVKEVFETALSR